MGLLERNQSEKEKSTIRDSRPVQILQHFALVSFPWVGCQPFGNFDMALVPAPAAEAPQVPPEEALVDKEATWKSVRGGLGEIIGYDIKCSFLLCVHCSGTKWFYFAHQNQKS